MKKFIAIVLIALSLVGCGSSESAVQTAIAETTTAQPSATYTPKPTETSIPTSTDTSTPEPTNTPTEEPTTTLTNTPAPTNTPKPTNTPTLTPTPFDTSECVDFVSHPDNWNLWHAKMDSEERTERTNPYYDALDGKCVLFFGGGEIKALPTDLIYTTIGFDLVIDEFTPQEVTEATYVKSSKYVDDYLIASEYSKIWGIWHMIESGKYEVLLRKIEPILDQPAPIMDDGIFNVGVESAIIPGEWKSVWPSEDCYWARLDAASGNIKDNHFGVGGVYVRLYESDMFESDSCAPWIYIRP